MQENIKPKKKGRPLGDTPPKKNYSICLTEQIHKEAVKILNAKQISLSGEIEKHLKNVIKKNR